MVLYIITIKDISVVFYWLYVMPMIASLIDYGECGNDVGILLRFEIKKVFEEAAYLPELVTLEGCNYLGDEIFPLKPWLLKPYPGVNLSEEPLVYNYRLSRCRRIIENTFGILVARWRILSTSISSAEVKNIENYVLACIA